MCIYTYMYHAIVYCTIIQYNIIQKYTVMLLYTCIVVAYIYIYIYIYICTHIHAHVICVYMLYSCYIVVNNVTHNLCAISICICIYVYTYMYSCLSNR